MADRGRAFEPTEAVRTLEPLDRADHIRALAGSLLVPPKSRLRPEHDHHRRRRRRPERRAKAYAAPGVRDQPRRLPRRSAEAETGGARARAAPRRPGPATGARADARRRARGDRV